MAFLRQISRIAVFTYSSCSSHQRRLSLFPVEKENDIIDAFRLSFVGSKTSIFKKILLYFSSAIKTFNYLGTQICLGGSLYFSAHPLTGLTTFKGDVLHPFSMTVFRGLNKRSVKCFGQYSTWIKRHSSVQNGQFGHLLL